MNLSLRAATSAAAAAVALALAPQAAPAAVTCSYDGGFHAMNVLIDAVNDKATIATDQFGALLVNGASCGGAAVNGVDGIYVKDVSGGRSTVELDATAGPFAPGATFEGVSSEIETYVDQGAGSDIVNVRGEAYGAGIAVGASGINLNAGSDAFGGDIDLKLADAEFVTVRGGQADDRLTGQGGAGTGSPYDKWLALEGAGGHDELHGGEHPGGGTFLDGGEGDDTLVSGAHGAFLAGGPGNDSLSGGPGTDRANYGGAAAGVRVDLGVAGPQDTGGAGIDTINGVDSVHGSDYDDVLEGDQSANRLVGFAGDDRLYGRGGNDYIGGEDGADTLRSGTGDDVLDGGAGEDTAAYDDAPGGVTLDLGVTDPQDSGGSGKQTLTTIEDLVGSAFADHLTGSADANAIDGGAGSDTIDGREGADRLAGGGGLDAIDSRDTSPDSVSCGEGPDSLAVDVLDTDAPDCASPEPGGELPGGAEPAPGGAPVLTVSVPHQSLRSARAHGLRVLLACSTACHAGGRLAATRAAARRLGLGRRAGKRLGRLGSIDLAAATPTTARVRLTRTARRALRNAHRVDLVLRAHAVDGSGHAAAPVRLPVKLRAS
jgi:Ca2+-binding RTX toxin-like protein